MSIKKWEEIAQQKRAVEEQRQFILNAFKERKIKDEMGGLTAEKLFRPITKRLIEKPPEEERQLPNYALDEGDELLNMDVLPFQDELPEEVVVPDYALPEEEVWASYDKNTLHSSAWETITLPDGKFNYDQLNSFIQKQIGKVDPAMDDSQELFTLFFDNSAFERNFRGLAWT